MGYLYYGEPGGNRTPDNPAPETGALSTELQVQNLPTYNILKKIF